VQGILKSESQAARWVRALFLLTVESIQRKEIIN